MTKDAKDNVRIIKIKAASQEFMKSIDIRIKNFVLLFDLFLDINSNFISLIFYLS